MTCKKYLQTKKIKKRRKKTVRKNRKQSKRGGLFGLNLRKAVSNAVFSSSYVPLPNKNLHFIDFLVNQYTRVYKFFKESYKYNTYNSYNDYLRNYKQYYSYYVETNDKNTIDSHILSTYSTINRIGEYHRPGDLDRTKSSSKNSFIATWLNINNDDFFKFEGTKIVGKNIDKIELYSTPYYWILAFILNNFKNYKGYDNLKYNNIYLFLRNITFNIDWDTNWTLFPKEQPVENINNNQQKQPVSEINNQLPVQPEPVEDINNQLPVQPQPVEDINNQQEPVEDIGEKKLGGKTEYINGIESLFEILKYNYKEYFNEKENIENINYDKVNKMFNNLFNGIEKNDTLREEFQKNKFFIVLKQLLILNSNKKMNEIVNLNDNYEKINRYFYKYCKSIEEKYPSIKSNKSSSSSGYKESSSGFGSSGYGY